MNEKLKKFTKEHTNEIVLVSCTVINFLLIRRYYKSNYIKVNDANSLIRQTFAQTKGDFTTYDGYEYFEITRKK